MYMTRFLVPGLLAALAAGAWTAPAAAAPALRVQVDQHGDFLLIGNTIGFECAAGTPAPVVGTIGVGACTQIGTNDTAPDLFWQSDAPAAGQATASLLQAPADARSTAVLTIPSGATVTHAFLYWAATNATNVAGTQVTFDRPGVGAFTATVDADDSFLPGTNNAYQSVADVTGLVQDNGSGAYRVSGIEVADFRNANNEVLFGGWTLVVFYSHPGDPLRDLALFDGMDLVTSAANQTVTLNGFHVPNAGFDGKLGVIAYEGDASLNGDQLFFNGGTALSDAQNPVNNFFNGTRSFLGTAVSNVGDLPQLTGTAQSMGGMDLDVVDITARLTGGQTSATVQATSTQDTYYLGAFITSITTFAPDFSTSTKTVTDINAGETKPGDVLQYTINVTNTGNDTSTGTTLTDPLPVGVTFVPGSLQILSGPNAGTKTDAVDADQAEFVAGTRTVTARLGTGANGVNGGQLAPGASTVLTFQVKVDADASGVISNQAIVNAGGLLGSPPSDTPTDGNGGDPGAPPTPIVIDQCDTNTDCHAPTPVCDTTEPKTCVQCLADSDCGLANSGEVCNGATHTCEAGCRGTGGNGCPNTLVCTSTDGSIGSCVGCIVDANCGNMTSGKVCELGSSTCIDGCRGTGGNGCPNGEDCTSTDNTIGTCVECTMDSDCGGPKSGKVCDMAASMCVDGCRGTGGNGCPTGDDCTSTDATIGQCVNCTKDSDCGGTHSGRICDTTGMCVDGCRGTDGNGCPNGEDCTSTDDTPGLCIECMKDADCGGPKSGTVCDGNMQCIQGCRGMGGNGCPDDDTCTSHDTSIGMCELNGTGGGGGAGGSGGQGGNGNGGAGNGGAGGAGGGIAHPKGVVAEGNGIACATSSGVGEGSAGWLMGALVAAIGLVRRRRGR